MSSDGFVWRSASPESQRMDGAKLAMLGSSLAARRTKAFLVVRHDRIVYEWYASGYGPSSRHYTASLAKALVGGMSLLLALSDGCIGIDDLACKYIPAWRGDPLKSQITIRHLVTHSSGIEDAELSAAERAKLLAEGRTLTDHHMSLPGWKGAFWRREPDPFSVAIHQAPVVYPPGTRYAYSNPGMAALAYAVTGSLQDTVYPDIRTLLQQRIMDPIGLPEDEWSIGYGRAYKVDGMDLYANWGGGEYTTRAIARVGRLMLRRGSWDGRQLIDPVWASRALGYAGTPRPVRSDRDLQPLSGIGWWTNSDGVWSCLSRDAFAGAGAGHQLLLVVPCRDVIVVRSGELLEAPTQREGFWGALDRRLLVPLMDTFLPRQERDARLAPYPPSSVIRDMAFEPPSAVVR